MNHGVDLDETICQANMLLYLPYDVFRRIVGAISGLEWVQLAMLNPRSISLGNSAGADFPGW